MNNKIERLIKQFAKLPRVGGRAATRIVLSLLQDKSNRATELAAALADTAATVRPCPVCGCLTDSDVCEFCRDTGRINGQLCIVRDMGDVWTLEKSGVFRGRYHILGGLLSGTAGTTVEDLNISNLAPRVWDEKITEIIFVLPNTIEGKTTQHYIGSVIETYIKNQNDTKISVPTFTELASGVPLGGDLDYIDDGTLTLAFGARKAI